MTDQTMLYRPGDKVNPEAWNLKLDTTIVDDADIDEALADGWFRHPADFPTVEAEAAEPAQPVEPAQKAEPGPYDSLLDAPVADIVPLLVEMSADELASLRTAEVTGKTRSGLLSKIDKAIEAKGA